MATTLAGTSGALFAVVGVVLIFGGFALVTNYWGAQDWLLRADTRRSEILAKRLFWPSRRGVKGTGLVLVGLGCVFLIASVSQL